MTQPIQVENNDSFRSWVKRRWQELRLKRMVYYASWGVLAGALLLEALAHFIPLLPHGEGVLSLVAAIACLGMLLILFELLLEVESEGKRGVRFPNLQEATSHILESLRKAHAARKNRDGVKVKMITSTASTAVSLIDFALNRIQDVDSRMVIMDPVRSHARWLGTTWTQEIRLSIDRIDGWKTLPRLREQRVTFEYRTYTSMPCLQGVLIGDRFLYLGYYQWTAETATAAPTLAGPANPFYFYDGAHPEDRHYLDLFDSWFEYYWKENELEGAAGTPPLRVPDPFWIIGHRGMRRNGVENTRASFSEAVEAGADWIEMDVHGARDALVVYHDEQVNGRPVKDQTLEEIREFKYPNGEQIPTLEEVIASTRPGVGLGIEIKEGAIENRVVDALRPLIGTRQIVAASFDVAILGRVKRLCPELRVGILTENLPVDWQRQMDSLGAEVLFPAANLVNPDVVKVAHQAGFRIVPWSVNEPDAMRHLIGLGVDGIITDDPASLAALVKSLRV